MVQKREFFDEKWKRLEKPQKTGFFTLPGPKRGGGGVKRGQKPRKVPILMNYQDPKKVGFSSTIWCSFIEKWGFSGFSTNSRGRFSRGGSKTGFLGVWTGFRGFRGKSRFFGQKPQMGFREQRIQGLNACNGFSSKEAVFHKEWVLITSERHHKASPVDPKEGPRRFEGEKQRGF